MAKPTSNLPPLAAIRAFEAAARLGSFTKAAVELGMTQAAVSYQIKILEERLGMPLFLRLPRQIALTEVGRRLSPVVTDAFEALRSAFGDVRETAEGVLSISATQSFAVKWLLLRLGQFQVAHPRLAVRLDAGDRLVDFAREEVDVAIRTGVGPWSGLEAHALCPVAFAPVCSPGLLERHDVRRPADLLRLPLLSPHDPWWPEWFALVGVDASELAQRPAIHLESQHLEGSLALAGEGVAMVTPVLWAAELADGRLVQPFEMVGATGGSYWLVYPATRRRSAKIRAFRDWLLAAVATTLPPAPPRQPPGPARL